MKVRPWIVVAAMAVGAGGCAPAPMPTTRPDVPGERTRVLPARIHAKSQPDDAGLPSRRTGERIAEADALLAEAIALTKGAAVDDSAARAAMQKYLTLIREYPQSDKVDDACFYAGEVLKEFLNQDAAAAEFYRLAYQTNPRTPHPAHFQRAVVLDYRLHRRAEAMVEYEAAIAIEAGLGAAWARSNADFARIRLDQLQSEDK